MVKAWSDEAWEEFLYWQNQDKKIMKRIIKILHGQFTEIIVRMAGKSMI